MLGQSVLLHVVIDVAAGPGEQGPECPGTAHRLQQTHPPAVIGLATADAAGPAAHPQIGEGAIEGLHLAQAVVKLQILHTAGFPQASVQGLHAGGAQFRLDHAQINAEELTQLLGIVIGLRGHVAGVDPQHRDRGEAFALRQLMGQMKKNRRLDAEAGGHHQAIGEGAMGPVQSPQGVEALQLHLRLLQRQGQIRQRNRPGTGVSLGGLALGRRAQHQAIITPGGICRDASRWVGFAHGR